MKDGRLPVWVDTVKKVAERIGNEYLVVGRADQGAFSLASMMRGMEDFFMDIAVAASDEKLKRRMHKLLQYCNDCQFEFVKALKAAGAGVICPPPLPLPSPPSQPITAVPISKTNITKNKVILFTSLYLLLFTSVFPEWKLSLS